jgi:GNAT superfamily N-acetyltransferase
MGEDYMNAIAVRRATSADADEVAATLDLAFHDDPISVWLFPDATHRRQLHRAFMRLFVDLGLQSGEVYVAGDAVGAAVWFPVDPAEQHDDEDFVKRAGALCGPYEPRLRELLNTMQANHPLSEPHLYLNFLAVRPQSQGQGIGAAMLRHRYRGLDADGLPAYLESSTRRSAALYAREGFGRQGAVTLPDGGPELTPMWRTPR